MTCYVASAQLLQSHTSLRELLLIQDVMEVIIHLATRFYSAVPKSAHQEYCISLMWVVDSYLDGFVQS